MRSTDRIRFVTALSALADYYGKPLSDGAIGLYWQGLQNFDMDQIERAIGIHLQNPDSGQWMPKIADLVRMLEGTSQDAAAMAWAKVQRAVGGVGQYQSLAFDDPLIHLVIDDLGGWPGICQCSEHELPFLAKRFENNYRAYRNRGGDVPQHLRYLPGVNEIANAAKGYKSDAPRLVGDAERAKRVLLGGSDKPRLQITAGEAAAEVVMLIARKDAA